MKGSTWVFAIVTFGAAILTFSRVYGEVVRYLTRPTPEGLVTIIGFSVLLLFLLGVMAFIIYAVDRRAGNVKNKVHVFERLLGFDKNAELPGQSHQPYQEEKK
jgi:hypothetical protein